LEHYFTVWLPYLESRSETTNIVLVSSGLFGFGQNTASLFPWTNRNRAKLGPGIAGSFVYLVKSYPARRGALLGKSKDKLRLQSSCEIDNCCPRK
jgi:hypothetical protein